MGDMSESTRAAIGRVMVQIMSDVSEDWWAARWFCTIEFAIWSKRPDYMEDQACRDLHELAATYGLWPVFDGEAHAIPLDEFISRYEAHVAGTRRSAALRCLGRSAPGVGSAVTPFHADTAIRGLTIRWRYQPMSDHERTAWKRYLRDVSLGEFGQALDIAVAQGGSRLANHPNQRPAVAEFAGIVNLVRRKQLMDTADPEPLPEIDPEAVKRHIDECRQILAGKGARR